jgi:integrase/recombinase XerD
MERAELLAAFTERLAERRAESTVLAYGHAVEEWLTWLADPGSLAYDPDVTGRASRSPFEATTADLRKFLRHQLKNRRLAGGTVRTRRWAVAAFYEELAGVREELGLPEFESPAAGLDLSDWPELRENETGEFRALDPSAVARLAASVPAPALRNELLVRLLYQTGLRRGELARLRLSELDTARRSVRVRAPEPYRERTVHYRPALDSLLGRWVDVERAGLVTAESPFLFPTPKSEHVSPEQVNRVVREAAAAAGLQRQVDTAADGTPRRAVTAGVLRHSFAVACADAGMDPRALQRLLGQADLSTAERYYTAAPDSRRAYRHHGPPPAGSG